MQEGRHRIKMITGWTGQVDGEEKTVKAGEQVDVDTATARALVFQYQKAELVTVEEIIAQAKKKTAKPTGQRASRRGQGRPPKDKQQKASEVK